MILSEIAQIHSASKSRQVLTVCSLLKLMEYNIFGFMAETVYLQNIMTAIICRSASGIYRPDMQGQQNSFYHYETPQVYDFNITFVYSR